MGARRSILPGMTPAMASAAQEADEARAKCARTLRALLDCAEVREALWRADEEMAEEAEGDLRLWKAAVNALLAATAAAARAEAEAELGGGLS